MSASILARQENDQFQLTITLLESQIKQTYDKLVQQTAKDIEIPGFRKGKAPLNKVIEHINLDKIYEQIIQQLVPQAYINAIKEHQLNPIIEPQIELVNQDININQDWQIRITSAEKPEIKLGDYQTRLKGLLKTTNIWTPGSASSGPSQKDVKEHLLKNNLKSPAPEETTPDDLKSQQAQKITDWLLQNIKVEPASILIEQHTHQLLAQLLEQIQKLGLTLDQYLTSTNKKTEDLKAEYARKARQNLRFEFIILAIGENEKIKVENQEIDTLINQSQDEKIKTALQKPEQKTQLYNIIFRQKVFDYLYRLAS